MVLQCVQLVHVLVDFRFYVLNICVNCSNLQLFILSFLVSIFGFFVLGLGCDIILLNEIDQLFVVFLQLGARVAKSFLLGVSLELKVNNFFLAIARQLAACETFETGHLYIDELW